MRKKRRSGKTFFASFVPYVAVLAGNFEKGKAGSDFF